MYGHERSLVEKYRDQPFAIIGVNSDKDLRKIGRIVKQKNLTWRSFWNGPQGPGGPIAARWSVRSWPTIFVIDHEGMIRYKNVRGAAMDKAVETLMPAAIEAAGQ